MLQFAYQSFICGFKTFANPQKPRFFLTNINLNALIKIFTKKLLTNKPAAEF